MITTAAGVEYKSVLSMPLNILLLSAAFPSGPVMWEVRPFASGAVIARMEPAALVAPFQPCLPKLMARMVWMALPSSTSAPPGVGGCLGPVRGSEPRGALVDD